jgi:hypothetical protein
VKQILGGRDALGARIRFGAAGDAVAIVGLAEDGKYASLGEAPTPVVFRPLAQAYNATTIVVARSRLRLPAADALRAIRRLVLELDRSIGLYDEAPLDNQLRLPRLPAQNAAGGIGALGLLTLVLAVTGVYGVLSYAVARRTREIGVRIAIGATRRDVLRLVFGRTAWLLAAGGGIGLAAASAASRLLAPYLYGASPGDSWVFAAVAATMTAAAALAAWVPARRATTVDPMAALRAD